MGNIFPLSIHWHIVCVCVDMWMWSCGHVASNCCWKTRTSGFSVHSFGISKWKSHRLMMATMGVMDATVRTFSRLPVTPDILQENVFNDDAKCCGKQLSVIATL